MAKETLNLVREYILDGLESGMFAKGHRLPAERKLAEKFGTTRATVRQALVILESEKRVARHVGRGTFVVGNDHASENETTPRPAWPRIDASPSQLMQARQLIEPQIAELVVLNATEGDLTRILAIVESQAEIEGEEFEQSDIEFHTALATATHNEVILATAKLLNSMRQDPEWRKLKAAVRTRNGGRRAEAVSEHRAVSAALQARNASEAVKQMRRHLDNVCLNLLGY